MTNSVVKNYIFKLKAQANAEQFLTDSKKVDECLLSLDGFIYRSVSCTENGEWCDSIYWENRSAAESAEPDLGEELVNALIRHIDVESVRASLSDVQTQVYPEMLAVEA